MNEFDTAEEKAQCYTSRKSNNPPKNWKDVHTKPDKDEWLNARVKELINLEGQYVWDDQPADARPVRIITLYTLKRLADGTVEQYKCRMVADCKKVTKSDVGETFQHVGQGDSLKMMCAHAAQFRRNLYITDIDKAFLQGDAASVLWCIPPEGLDRPIGANGRKKIWKVIGNLYGKLDAPRVFGQCYETHLLNFPTVDAMGNVTHVMKGNADPSMLHYTRTYVDGTVTKCSVLTYVDDNAWEFAPDQYGWCLYRDICDHVNTKFAIKKDDRGERYGGEAKSFLGCQIKHDWETDTVELSLPGKIEDLLVSTGMQNANSVATTGSTNKPLHSQASPPPLGTGEPCPARIDYQSICGALLWIARMGRPDIMHRSAELARFMHAPGDDHAQELMHLLRYLKGTQYEKLVYKRDPEMNWDNYAFLGYVDSDFAPDYGDEYRNMKSTMGWIFTQNDVAMSWRSRKEPVFADSTTAAEYIAAADASKQTVWVRRWYTDMGHPQMHPTPLFEDNESCMKLVKNYCGHDKIKHLDIRHAVVREHHAKGMIEMHDVPDRDQLADVFTKVKPGPQTRRMRSWMLTGAVPADCTVAPSSVLKMHG